MPMTAAALLASGTVHADTRSSGAMSAPDKQSATAARGNPQGPKRGFPDNDGIRNAKEHANEHARFLRHDSEG